MPALRFTATVSFINEAPLFSASPAPHPRPATLLPHTTKFTPRHYIHFASRLRAYAARNGIDLRSTI